MRTKTAAILNPGFSNPDAGNYSATPIDGGKVQRFGRMQDAKRYAVSRGNGGILVDEDLDVSYRVSRKGVEDFYSLKALKGVVK